MSVAALSHHALVLDPDHPLLAGARAAAREQSLAYAGVVTPEQAWALATEQAAVLVDVRTAEERKFVGHVPGTLHVAAGTTVRFVNEDAEAHEVVTSGKDAIDSGAIDPHAGWRYTFAKPGTYQLLCGYHPYMKATVVVR